MSLFKKEKPKTSWVLNKFDELEQAVHDSRNRLMTQTQNTIVKMNVVNLYPEGPDKDHALKDFAEQQYKFICAIGHYDARRAEAINFCKEHEKELEGYGGWGTSHELIEIFYKNYYNK